MKHFMVTEGNMGNPRASDWQVNLKVSSDMIDNFMWHKEIDKALVARDWQIFDM